MSGAQRVNIEGGFLDYSGDGDEIGTLTGRVRGGIRILSLLALRLQYAACRWADGEDAVEALRDDAAERGDVLGTEDVTVDVSRAGRVVTVTARDEWDAALRVAVTAHDLALAAEVDGDATPALMRAMGDALWRGVQRGLALPAVRALAIFGEPFAAALAAHNGDMD